MMTYSIFDAGRIGPLLELEQSGTVLAITDIADINRTALALQPQSVGRWYAELLVYGTGDLLASIGIAQPSASLSTYVGGDALGYGYRLDLGQIRTVGASVANVAAAAKGDMIGVLLDLTTSTPTVTWYRNGQLVNTQSLPGTGPWALAASLGGSEPYGLRCFLNAGQRAFDYPQQGLDGWYKPTPSLSGLRLASDDWMTAPDDEVPNRRYEGLIAADTGEMRAVRSLDFWPWQRGIKSGAMSLTLLDPDNRFAELLSSDARDLPVSVGRVQAGQRYADRVPLYRAVVDSVSVTDDVTVKLTCRDPLGLLDVPLQRRLVRPDADPSAANQPWPILLGACRNVPALAIDATTYTYAVSDAAVLGVGYCRDKGYPLDPAAAPADFTLGAGKTTLTLHSQPQGRVTIDASSVGGDQLPTPSDDILGGAGNPFTGTDGQAPTGFDDVGGDVPQAAPILQGGTLEFPLVQVAPTIYAELPIMADGVTGSAALRISWLDADGNVAGTSLSPTVTGTAAWAIKSVIDTAPAAAVRARLEAVAINHTAGTIRVGAISAWYVLYGDHTAIGLQNPNFDAGATGWTATTAGWIIGTGSPLGGNFAKYTGAGVSEYRNDGVAPVAEPGARISASINIALDQRGSATNVSGQLYIRWLDASSNFITQTPSVNVHTGNKGRYQLVSVTGTAPAGAAYAQLSLGANGNGTDPSGALFDVATMSFALEPTSGQRVIVPLSDLTQADAWQLGTGWSLQPAGPNGYNGAAYAEHAAGAGGESALRSTQPANVRQAVAYAGWAGISAAKLGAGASYKVTITITDMPDDGASYVGLATGKTIDTMLVSWKQPGTYTVTVTNTDGVDHALYLLSIPYSGGTGSVPVPPTIGSIEVIHYDDTFNPDPRATEPATLQAISLADCLHALLDVRAAAQDLQWSRTDAEAIDTATGYAGVGLFLQGGETVRQALDLVLPSYTACLWADAAGVLRVSRLIAPESVPVASRAGTIDINALASDLIPQQDTAPGLSTQMGVRRNWAVMSDGDLVTASTNFPLVVRNGMLRAYQTNVSTAAQLSRAYGHAQYAAPATSCFDRAADGQAEIDRIGAIYTVARWFYSCTLELDAVPDIDLGQVWVLEYPKYGLQDGKAVMVIDFEPDLLANTAAVILWG